MDNKSFAILAIDDSRDDLYILEEHLHCIESWHTNFFGSESWESGIEELAQRQIDIIFLDYNLGKQTGLEILRKIRASGDQRPVIVLTGQGDEHIAAELGKAGADEYLVKGDLSPSILRLAVEKAINEYQARKEHLLLSEQLQQSQKMETIGELAGGIAHDFNNMLTGIMGYIELALMKSTGRDIEHDLTKAQQACKNMAKVVHQLVNFSRKSPSVRSEVSVARLIEDTRSVIKHTLPKNIRINTIPSNRSLSVFADSSAIQQIILNLCINAADAMPGGGTIDISARPFIIDKSFALMHVGLQEGEYVMIEIHDSGKGIEREHLNRIFEPFFSTKQRDHNKGTGLGLAIVWRSVCAHGGTVTVDSELNVGTTFRVYLPSHTSTSGMNEYISNQTAIPQGHETILLADDENIVRTVASELLMHLGYKVYLASNGIEALQILKKYTKDIDIVILDLSMPQMGGKECIGHLKKIAPSVPVLFASGHNMDDESDSLLALGAAGLIQKPYQLVEFSSKVRAALDLG